MMLESNLFRKLSREFAYNAFLPTNHAWVTKDGHGYCTKCAKACQAEVTRIRTRVVDDVCDTCLKPFSVNELGL